MNGEFGELPFRQIAVVIFIYSKKPSCQVSLSKSLAITFTLVSALKVVSALTVT